MKKMRRVVIIAVLCVFVATPIMAGPFGHGDGYDGGTAYWDRNGDYYQGQGGEFTIWGNPGLVLSNSAYADTTSGLTWGGKGGSESFQTFCMEMSERIYEPMRIWVSEEAAGPELDYNGSGSHAWYGSELALGGDNLDSMTAYLYTQFATGVLSDYDYLGLGASRSTSAEQLQNVFWYIEEEFGVGDTPSDALGSGSQALKWYDEAFDAVDLGGDWEGMGIGDVRVLQFYQYNQNDDEYCRKQDQLYLTPIPGAAILGILGLCVAGVKLRKYA